MGTAPVRGVQLFWPQDYGRLLLVFDDGRLAYDPGDASDGLGLLRAADTAMYLQKRMSWPRDAAGQPIGRQ